MEPIDSAQALRILEAHAIVPADERQRAELFAAFSVFRLMALDAKPQENMDA
ncbi:hypothetical protein [Streptomyces sp. NPDC093269]|uniref:hypothetical protein n=1 Tax=Streptomyces sp. NPDC093269 TaxID=3366038 RepID=UPI0037F7B870